MEKQVMKERKAKDNKHASVATPAAGTWDEKKPELQQYAEKRRTSASVIANGPYCKINWYHPALRKAFPGNHKMWSVDKLYPQARFTDHEGTVHNVELFIEEPRLAYKIREAKMKLEVLKPLGIRFLILKNGTTPMNAVEGFVTDDDVVESIEDFGVQK